MTFKFDGTICLMCKKPLLIFTEHTGELRPFCNECAKKVEDGLGKMFERRGKSTKGKKLIFPKMPEGYTGG